MDRYDVRGRIGEGSFGDVFLAVHKDTGEKRAIKRLKGLFSWERLMCLRELQCVITMQDHPNIVKLFDVICLDNSGYFVFEYMSSGDLLQYFEYRAQNKLGTPPDAEIRCLLQQILRGLQHLHQAGITHRDIKPENILLDGRVCKVADFSLARRQDEIGQLTDYVSTRWYRAPEVSIDCPTYTDAIDIFAVGCIGTELFTLVPLFQGKDDIDLLRLHFQFLGSPQSVGWNEGVRLLRDKPINLSSQRANARSSLYSTLPPPHNKCVTVDFLQGLLSLNPASRFTATRALQHPFFDGVHSEELLKKDLPSAVETIATTTTGTPENYSLSSNGGSAHTTTPSPNTNLPLQQQQLPMVTISPAPLCSTELLSHNMPAPTTLGYSPPPIHNPYVFATKRCPLNRFLP